MWRNTHEFGRSHLSLPRYYLVALLAHKYWGVLNEHSGKFIGLFCGLLAGFFPAIYSSLEMGMHVDEIGEQPASTKSPR